jgi:hypothetical protein
VLIATVAQSCIQRVVLLHCVVLLRKHAHAHSCVFRCLDSVAEAHIYACCCSAILVYVNREDEEERIRNAGGFIVHKV